MGAAVSFDDVCAAANRIAGIVHRTPTLTCRALDERLGLRVVMKCEGFQKVGAFKYRGATNAVRLLTEAEAAHGVLTHSSGNHAQALALAARVRGIPAWIVMPEDAPAIKRRAVEGYGATVVTCAPTLEAREATAGSWACSADSIRRDLGFSPAQPLQQRLCQTVDWYVEQEWL